mgnify:CR=1 FL=1
MILTYKNYKDIADTTAKELDLNTLETKMYEACLFWALVNNSLTKTASANTTKKVGALLGLDYKNLIKAKSKDGKMYIAELVEPFVIDNK